MITNIRFIHWLKFRVTTHQKWRFHEGYVTWSRSGREEGFTVVPSKSHFINCIKDGRKPWYRSCFTFFILPEREFFCAEPADWPSSSPLCWNAVLFSMSWVRWVVHGPWGIRNPVCSDDELASMCSSRTQKFGGVRERDTQNSSSWVQKNKSHGVATATDGCKSLFLRPAPWMNLYLSLCFSSTVKFYFEGRDLSV